VLRSAKKYVAITLIVGVIGLLLTLYDSHRVNFPYFLWKNNLYASYHFKFKYLNVDKDFREFLLRYFPDAYPVSQSNDYQEPYMRSFKTADALWLGETNWGAEIFNNKVQKIVLMKG